MKIEDHIYIYYKNEYDYIKLEDVKKQLQDPEANRERIINDFKKKFKNDYIKSSKRLLKEGFIFMYPISTILTSGIDVLAKYYSGEIEPKGNKSRFINFLEQRASSLCRIIDKKDMYGFRCGIVHSNSTRKTMIIDDIPQGGSNEDLIDLHFLIKQLEELLNNYIDSLRTDNQIYDNFIKIYKYLYEN